MSRRYRHRQFDDSFVFGVATAAFQIEGAQYDDGRRDSIWDAFCRVDGAVINGDDGSVACDHYHRYRDDVEIMAVARRAELSLLDVVVEDPPRRRAGQPGRTRLLLAAGRRTARPRHHAVADALPLGPAAGDRGRGRLAQPGHGVPLQRVRPGRPRSAGRPRAGLDHAERALVLGVPRLRRRRPRPRCAGSRRRPGRHAPSAARPRPRRPGAPVGRSEAPPGPHPQPDAGGPGPTGVPRRPARRSARSTGSSTGSSSTRSSEAAIRPTCWRTWPGWVWSRRSVPETSRSSPVPSTPWASTTTKVPSSVISRRPPRW